METRTEKMDMVLFGAMAVWCFVLPVGLGCLSLFTPAPFVAHVVTLFVSVLAEVILSCLWVMAWRARARERR